MTLNIFFSGRREPPLDRVVRDGLSEEADGEKRTRKAELISCIILGKCKGPMLKIKGLQGL